jgi:hypothetical protein
MKRTLNDISSESEVFFQNFGERERANARAHLLLGNTSGTSTNNDRCLSWPRALSFTRETSYGSSESKVNMKASMERDILIFENLL